MMTEASVNMQDGVSAITYEHKKAVVLDPEAEFFTFMAGL